MLTLDQISVRVARPFIYFNKNITLEVTTPLNGSKYFFFFIAALRALGDKRWQMN
jgi:hypothetical protein